jgi:NADH:ubiquinone reductase (H+-translocating)
MHINIPDSTLKRVVIIGCGFAGLELAMKLRKSNYQVIIIDKNNYHQFQPLFYQVATAGLEPRDISFPIRKIFQKEHNIFIRITELQWIHSEKKTIETSMGNLHYDYLILAMGANTSFFGMKNLQRYARPMKNVLESIELLNVLLHNFEDAIVESDSDKRQGLLNLVVVGGGPTGVEISGSLVEMKKYVLPKDYPELDCNRIRIILIEASPRLLNGMSEKSSKEAREYLIRMGVEVLTDTQVKDYDGQIVFFNNHTPIHSNTVIWAAGIAGNKAPGLPESVLTRGNRIQVNRFNAIEKFDDIFVLGDLAYMTEESFPNGHPQVAQVAIQQARNLARNLRSELPQPQWKPFCYKDLGSMATIGRNKAVVDLPYVHFKGLFAWMVWMLIHLRSIFGLKNKIFIFINWVWNYITYDQSLRLIFLPKQTSPKSNQNQPIIEE